MTMWTQNGNTQHGHCNHSWERRPDLDATFVLRFSCSKCEVLGFRKLSPSQPIRAYPDGRRRMPEFGSPSKPTAIGPRRRFLSDPVAVEEWLERKAWIEMLEGGCS
jgi:hypothetical protein